uniref:Uncharacterized protein n=1 Tax=Acrobeloides nanus TaxID=290746 RepID=A0A914ES85_9BILA
MVCNCIPPPPIFDLPPPPDPSLIWGVISDEPLESLQKVRLKSCEFTPFFNIFRPSIEFENFSSSETGLYFLIFIFTVIITACTCATCLLRCRKYRRKRAASSINSSRFNSSSDTIVTGNATHYNSIKPLQHHIEFSNGHLKMVPAGIHLYGSKSASNIVGITSSPRAMPTATLIRSMPKRIPSNNFVTRNTAIRIPTEVYYTVGRHYEEIAETTSNQPPHLFDSFVEDINQNLRYFDAYQIDRKPPPTSRPPPPPGSLLANSPDSVNSGTNSGRVSPGFRDELSSSTEPELEKFNQENEEQHLPRSRLGDIGGRESGYGTGTSRLWHSPQILHRQRKRDGKSPSVSLETPPSNFFVVNSKNPTPIQICDQTAAQTITYV